MTQIENLGKAEPTLRTLTGVRNQELSPQAVSRYRCLLRTLDRQAAPTYFKPKGKEGLLTVSARAWQETDGTIRSV